MAVLAVGLLLFFGIHSVSITSGWRPGVASIPALRWLGCC
jgi:hypothetical protein